jgi:hypothetical protein
MRRRRLFLCKGLVVGNDPPYRGENLVHRRLVGLAFGLALFGRKWIRRIHGQTCPLMPVTRSVAVAPKPIRNPSGRTLYEFGSAPKPLPIALIRKSPSRANHLSAVAAFSSARHPLDVSPTGFKRARAKRKLLWMSSNARASRRANKNGLYGLTVRPASAARSICPSPDRSGPSDHIGSRRDAECLRRVARSPPSAHTTRQHGHAVPKRD